MDCRNVIGFRLANRGFSFCLSFFFSFWFFSTSSATYLGTLFCSILGFTRLQKIAFRLPRIFYVRFQLCSWTVMYIYLDTWVQGTFKIRCPRVEYALLQKKNSIGLIGSILCFQFLWSCVQC